jgi:hypothetical protein
MLENNVWTSIFSLVMCIFYDHLLESLLLIETHNTCSENLAHLC